MIQTLGLVYDCQGTSAGRMGRVNDVTLVTEVLAGHIATQEGPVNGRQAPDHVARQTVSPPVQAGDGKTPGSFDEALSVERITPEGAPIELLNPTDSDLGHGTRHTQAEPVERPEEMTDRSDITPGRVATEPPSLQSLRLERDSHRTGSKPAEELSKIAEAPKGAIGLEHIAPEEVAVEPLSRIVYHTDPTGLGADRFRYLRLRLREFSKAGKLKSVLVTSPLPQDGKSTIALNLAAALAERGESAVLLLEADLYQPVLATRLRLRAGPGLAECLISGLDPISALRRVEPLGLYLLLGGKPLGNPGDFLHGDAFAGIMDVLAPHFKWIVIDSPPIAPLADTLALARHADASLLVVRSGQTPREAVDAAIESLGAKHILGVVLNGVEGLARRYAKYSKYYRPSAGK